MNDGLLPFHISKYTAQAHWLSREFIAWPTKFKPESNFTFHYAPDGGLLVTPQTLEGGYHFSLEFISTTLNDRLSEKYPHLSKAMLLKISEVYLELVPEILKGQFAISASDHAGGIRDAAGLQIPGVLDDLYANHEQLGVSWYGEVPILKVWAPTARSVLLHLYDRLPGIAASDTKNHHQIIPMEWNPKNGTWGVTGKPEWKEKYYLYEIQVFVPQKGAITANLVTDPYSVSLSTNSRYSQLGNLSCPTLFPSGWSKLEKPPLKNFTDVVLYEVHLRDFTIRDPSIPEEHRGTYLAFTHPQSTMMQHLTWLANNGVTHVHLLPVFDFATIDEKKENWISLDWDLLKSFPPNSEDQQKRIKDIREKDGYNWGYDPLHFTVPEGSYSINPDGTSRILEFRKMIQALNRIGLRVVMDVVYNHTNASGQSEKSILDRIVPGYYHRLDENGHVTSSTCCPNTATEHAMMRKLMIDSILTWAVAYKIDGFRFDLMGHHMKSDILEVRHALDQLTQDRDGIDGKKIILYGEGWDFGEVANGAYGVNATQANMAGTGIGAFNDRLRDAIRGGTPFGAPMEQGYVTGLFTDSNCMVNQDLQTQRIKLLKIKDDIRIALAGNLSEYKFINYLGELVTGAEILYNNQPSGYGKMPQENIAYVSAHDNETLYDAIQLKLPRSTTILDRVKTQILALSLVTFSQGIPFFHAGCELLRSKSMDRDSHNSSDWYNAIDWTFQGNNWGHGLPPEDTNRERWPLISDLLLDPQLIPSQEHIHLTREIFGLLLQIRHSSPLFRLQTAEQIYQLVHFHNTGPQQVPGCLVMSLRNNELFKIDPESELIFVVFNAAPSSQSFQLQNWQVQNLNLHPALQKTKYASGGWFDQQKQTFHLPPRSTLVFISPCPPIDR